MYNRYIRNDSGGFTRVPQEEPHHREQQRPKTEPKPPKEQTQRPTFTPPVSAEHSGNRPPADALSGMLRHVLNQLKLDRVDTGDLLLLGLLFFLFRENADEELLVALGLLLIL